MGVDAIKESFIINEESINMALIYFSEALHCELGKELPELQLMRGKCMRVKVGVSIVIITIFMSFSSLHQRRCTLCNRQPITLAYFWRCQDIAVL